MLLCFEVLSELLPVLIFAIFYGRHLKKEGIAVAGSHICLLALFIIYLMGVFHFTGAGTLFESTRFGLELRYDQINLIPFSKNINWIGHGLNVVLFIPLGVLLPLLWKKYQRLLPVAATGLAFSVLIELSQLLNIRVSDVDDLILNTLGALLGYLLGKPLSLLAKKMGIPASDGGAMAWGIILLVFFGRFFLYDEMLFASYLYGF